MAGNRNAGQVDAWGIGDFGPRSISAQCSERRHHPRLEAVGTLAQIAGGELAARWDRSTPANPDLGPAAAERRPSFFRRTALSAAIARTILASASISMARGTGRLAVEQARSVASVENAADSAVHGGDRNGAALDGAASGRR